MANALLRNCHLISPGLEILDAVLEIRDGKISRAYAAGAFEAGPLPADLPVQDLGGNRVVPGFIDIHTHGAGGADVTDGTLAALQTIAERKLSEGVTTWLPTTLTLPQEQLRHILRTVEAFRTAAQPLSPISVPGIHLEGPFINPKAVGAQNPAFVRVPDIAALAELAEITPIRILSLATEMPGGLEMVRWATERNMVCSLAHTTATRAEFLEAKAAGLRHLTHFCNQMTPLHHREVGIVGSGLMDPDIRLELICDGIHLSPEMLKLVFALKPLEQLLIITDSMAASHLGDGNFPLGGLEVNVKDGQARLSSGALAGSTLRYQDGLRLVHELTGLPLTELLSTTSWNQARSLGLTDRGSIAPGLRADLAILRSDFSVVGTLVAGELAFGKFC